MNAHIVGYYIADAVVYITYHPADKIVMIVSLVFVVQDESGIENEVALVEALLVAKLLEDTAMVQRAR